MATFAPDRPSTQPPTQTQVPTPNLQDQNLPSSRDSAKIRQNIMNRAAPSTVDVKEHRIDVKSGEATADLSYTRSTTVVPHAQNDAPTPAQRQGDSRISGMGPSATLGFMDWRGTNAASSDFALSNTGELTKATPSAATLETIPPNVRTEHKSYQVTDRQQLELKLKEFHTQLQVAQRAFAADVKYEFAKDKMDPKTRAALGEVAKAVQMLDSLPGLEDHRFTIHGHTDSKAGLVRNAQGQIERFDNQALSENRANDMREALIKLGANPERIAAVGHGASQPVAPNELTVGGREIDNPEGRAQNRRSELSFSMTQVEYQAYLREMEIKLARESIAHVTENKTVSVPRPEVEHLETHPNHFGNLMASGGIETLEQRQAREALEATKARIEAAEALKVANALDRICDQKVDLKISEYKGQPFNLAVRADKENTGNYRVSVYSPHSGLALETTKYSPKGVELESSQQSLPSLPHAAIRDGLKEWAERQN